MKPYEGLKEHILLVEDEEPIRLALSALLKEEGYLVTEACDGSGALRLLLSGFRPAFLITDLEMPRMNGEELIRVVVSQRIEIKAVILFSAASSTDPRIQRIRAAVGKLLPFSFVSKGEGDIVGSLIKGIRMLI
ncbi:MAG: response regulator [Oligoflexia bacterium]|nr:response regulator [Oligoflexia bacterium]